MATVNTINDLPALGRTPTSGDKLALQPQGDNTKSIDYDALATAIINKLGGDPVTVEHGGFGGTTVAQARTNLSVYSKAETDSAIQQSTADKGRYIYIGVASWDAIYNKLITGYRTGEATPILIGTSAVSLMTNGAVTSGALVGVVSLTNPGTGKYTFFAVHHNCDFSCMWEINGLTSASATPTIINFKKIGSTAYLKNDTETFNNVIGLAGFISSGATKIELYVSLPKSLAGISTISCTKFYGTIRGVNGYVNSIGSSAEWTTMSGITLSVDKAADNMVRFTLTSSSAYTNVTNNTPIHASAIVTLSFT